MTQQVPTEDYDLIIVGAGLVGASLVCCLQGLSLRILLLDQAEPAVCLTDFESSRPLSLADSSYRLLQQLGLWDKGEGQGLALAQHAAAIAQVHVSEQNALFHTLFDAGEYDLSALGQVVPAQLLQAHLVQAAVESSTFIKIKQLVSITTQAVGDLVQGEQHRATSPASNRVSLVYEDEDGKTVTVRAGLLIGADGANSQVCALAQFAKQSRQQNAVAICGQLEASLHGRAYERFVSTAPGGVLALLPQGERRAAMVWVMSQQQADLAQSWSNQQWQDALAAAMCGHIASPIIFKKTTASYPLQTMSVEQPAREAIILVGNAAHTLYPLAAQGFNLSLRDVATLAELIAARCRSGQGLSALADDSTCQSLLNDYLQRTQADQARIIKMTDRLVCMLNMPKLPGIRQLRSLGLLGLSLFLPAKNKIGKQCLGHAGPVPRLMRGLEVMIR